MTRIPSKASVMSTFFLLGLGIALIVKGVVRDDLWALLTGFLNLLWCGIVVHKALVQATTKRPERQIR